MKGKFIVIEGIDGSGKTTQISLLKEYFDNFMFTTEPTNSSIGELIRYHLKINEMVDYNREGFNNHDLLIAQLCSADRIHHLYSKGGIIENLMNGVNVISSRYYQSSLAYQTTDYSDFVYISKINERTIVPDKIIYLICDVDKSLERISYRHEKDLYETKDKITKVKKMYMEQIIKENDVVIDTTNKTIDEVFLIIKKEIEDMI